jgi:O-antigen/teichoic acid export membrane protein
MQLAVQVAGFVSVVLLARFLLRADFGRFTVAAALVSLVSTLADYGTSAYLLREGARRPADLGRLLGAVQSLRLLLGVLLVGVATLSAIALGFDATTVQVVALLALASALKMAGTTALLGLQVLERVGELAVVRSVIAALEVAGTAITLVLGGGVRAVAFVLAGVAATSPVVAWARVRRHLRGRIRLTSPRLGRTLRAAAPFAATAVLFAAVEYLDSIIIRVIRGNVATGLYGAAYRILIALQVVPLVITQAMTRSITSVATTDRERMARLHATGVRYLTIAAAPLALGGALVSGPLLHLIYGPRYEGADAALSLLLLSLVPVFAGWMSITTSYAVGLERPVALLTAALLLANGVGNVLLVPAYGIEAAAAVTLGTDLVFWVAITALLARHGVPPRLRNTVVRPVAAALVMAACVVPLRHLPLAVPIAVGAVVFAIALILVRAVRRDDLGRLRGLLGGRAAGSESPGDSAPGPR